MSSSSWYLAKDDRRKVRQVVIELPAGGAQDPKFGSLGLAAKYEDLMRQSWCAGYFRTDTDKGPFFLVRADGHVAHLKNCSLQVAFSFYQEPAGGLFGIFVAAESPELRRASQTGHAVFECIYGLDYHDMVERIQDALAREVIHMCFADASTSLTVRSMQPDGTLKELTPPACRFDRVYPIPDACRQALGQHFRELLGYHRSLPPNRRDFRRSMQQIGVDFPTSEHPVLGRAHAVGTSPNRLSFLKRLFGGGPPPQSPAAKSPAPPFDKLEHIVIFARQNLESFKPSDEILGVLEQMTGRTIEEIRGKAHFQLFRNSGTTIDEAKKGRSISIIAAAELAMKGDSSSAAERTERAMAYSQNASELYFRESHSGEDFAIVLLYGR